MNSTPRKYYFLYHELNKPIILCKKPFMSFETKVSIVGQFLSDLWFQQLVNNHHKYNFYIISSDYLSYSNTEFVQIMNDFVSLFNKTCIDDGLMTFDKFLNNPQIIANVINTDKIDFSIQELEVFKFTLSNSEISEIVERLSIKNLLNRSPHNNSNNIRTMLTLESYYEDTIQKVHKKCTLDFTSYLRHNYTQNLNNMLIYSTDSKYEMLISTPVFNIVTLKDT
jgi:hypothetical protein